MFAYIKGIVQEKEMGSSASHRLVLECHGFGLELHVSQQTLANLPDTGEEAQIHTVFVVKETEFTLFGFATREEKELFALLTSVSGIGPKLALGLLGSLSPEQLCDAIIKEDDRMITQAPGVGAKVAGRIILELKTKIENWQQNRLAGALYAPTGQSKHEAAIDGEVRTILSGLGYSQTEIVHALTTIRKQSKENNVEGLVRESLKLLGAGSIV